MLLKKSISYFMNIMYKHIFLNFGVISFINKEIVSLFQLHTYKFGLVYMFREYFVIADQLANLLIGTTGSVLNIPTISLAG